MPFRGLQIYSEQRINAITNPGSHIRARTVKVRPEAIDTVALLKLGS